MRFAAVAGLVLLSGSLIFAQKAQDTGLSKHANVGHKSASSGSAAITPNTKANADALTKIEQQRVSTQGQPARRSSAVASAAPKNAAATQNKNKPIKFSYHPPPKGNNASH
jgi:hypothetical protein